MTASTVILNKGGGGQRLVSSVDANGLETLCVQTSSNLIAIAKGEVLGVTQFLEAGKNPNVTTAGIPEDVWDGGGLYTGFPDEVETLEIASSSAADTAAGTGARTVEISLLQDASGNPMPNITVTLNGTSQVSLGAGLYRRTTRMKVLTAGSDGHNVGELTLRHTTTTTNIFAVMPALTNHTAICAYSVPLGFTLYLNHIDARVTRGAGASVSAEVSLRVRKFGGVFQSKRLPSITDAQGYIDHTDYIEVIPALSDVIIRADTVSTNGSIVSGEIGGILEAD